MPLRRQYPHEGSRRVSVADYPDPDSGATPHGARHSGRPAFLATVTLTFVSSPLTVADEKPVSMSRTAGRAT